MKSGMNMVAIRSPHDLSAGDKVMIEMMTGSPSHGTIELLGTLRLAVFKNGKGKKPTKIWVSQRELNDPDVAWYKEVS